jgi:hypothetical protein
MITRGAPINTHLQIATMSLIKWTEQLTMNVVNVPRGLPHIVDAQQPQELAHCPRRSLWQVAVPRHLERNGARGGEI